MTSKFRAKQFRTSQRKAVELAQLVIIICEGEKTEIDYFGKWKEVIGKKARLVIEQAEGTAPQSIVQSAIDREREMRKENPVIWCVGDQDEWPTQVLNDEIQRARSKGFGYVLSVPCLEIWFILHYELFTRPEERHDVQKLSKAKLPTAPLNQGAKTLNRLQVDALYDRHTAAIANAKALERENKKAGKIFPENPSTNMYELVEYLISLT